VNVECKTIGEHGGIKKIHAAVGEYLTKLSSEFGKDIILPTKTAFAGGENVRAKADGDMNAAKTAMNAMNVTVQVMEFCFFRKESVLFILSRF
jgi:hypothetical protein